MVVTLLCKEVAEGLWEVCIRNAARLLPDLPADSVRECARVPAGELAREIRIRGAGELVSWKEER